MKKTFPADMSLLRPVGHRQLVLFGVHRDLRLGLWDKFPPPPDPGLEAAFAQFVRDHAAAHGWAKNYTATIQRAIRIMLGIQDTPGAPIRRSDVMLLTRIKHSAATATEVIAAAGMLEDDIEPPVVRWFNAKTAALPEPMRRELGVWLDVMRNGSTIPPRSKPRSDDTIRAQLAFALPVLQSWAATCDSLREISRADVLAAVPPSGQPRATTVQGLRSIFRALRSRKLIFTNPTFRIHVPAQAMAVPPAVDQAALRDALDSPSPARAVITALLAYHAIPMRQLAQLQLTDIRGGRLHLDDRVILLAGPVRDRVDAYLSYRAVTWPTTVNAHLFIHVRNWNSTRPVTSAWIGQQLGHLRRVHPPGPHLPRSRGDRRRHPRPVRPVRHVHRQCRPLGHHHRPHHRAAWYRRRRSSPRPLRAPEEQRYECTRSGSHPRRGKAERHRAEVARRVH